MFVNFPFRNLKALTEFLLDPQLRVRFRPGILASVHGIRDC